MHEDQTATKGPDLQAWLDGDWRQQFVLIEQQGGRYVVGKRVGPDHVQPVLDQLTLRRAVAASGVQTEHIAREIQRWKDTADVHPEPHVIALDDQPGLAWCRLPFRLPPADGPEAWPAWDEYVSRLSDPGFYMAWLGSVFDMGNRSRQILWIQGQGQDGKSTTFRVMYESLGTCMATVPDVGMGEDGKRFLAMQAYGHRMVVVSDCKNTKLLRAGIIRNLTSGDLVSIEGKGKDGFTAVTWTKLAVCSNEFPDISSGRADISRAVVLTVQESHSKSDASWEVHLRREFPQFLSSCIAAYKAACPGRGEIPFTEETRRQTLGQAQDSEAELETIADSLVIIAPGLSCHIGQLRLLCKQEHRLTRFEADDLIRYLKGRGIKQDGVRLLGVGLKGGQSDLF